MSCRHGAVNVGYWNILASKEIAVAICYDISVFHFIKPLQSRPSLNDIPGYATRKNLIVISYRRLISHTLRYSVYRSPFPLQPVVMWLTPQSTSIDHQCKRGRSGRSSYDPTFTQIIGGPSEIIAGSRSSLGEELMMSAASRQEILGLRHLVLMNPKCVSYVENCLHLAAMDSSCLGNELNNISTLLTWLKIKVC